jgi:hypothetical protein
MEEIREKLKTNLGNIITLKGKLSNIQWQHMIKFVDTHQNINYVDLRNDYQIVVYTKEEITCDKQIELKGKIIKLRGSKRSKSKVNDSYVEYQMIVDSWKCIE